MPPSSRFFTFLISFHSFIQCLSGFFSTSNLNLFFFISQKQQLWVVTKPSLPPRSIYLNFSCLLSHKLHVPRPSSLFPNLLFLSLHNLGKVTLTLCYRTKLQLFLTNNWLCLMQKVGWCSNKVELTKTDLLNLIVVTDWITGVQFLSSMDLFPNPISISYYSTRYCYC